jgi:hypothetical protein
MKLGKYLGAAAAASLIAAPVMAAPINPAAKLSLSKQVRAGKATTRANLMQGNNTVLISIAAVVAAIIVIILITDNDGSPNSP